MQWAIHIGIQKTGSKALQDFLSTHANEVQGASVLFATSGRENIWHEPIYTSLEIGDGQKLDDAQEELKNSGKDLGILSCEAFSLLSTSAIELIVRKISNPKIVVFLRRQDDFCNSWINQLVKAHRTAFSDVRAFESSLREYSQQLDFRLLIQNWARIFGEENIIPIIYKKHKDTVKSFLDSLGLSGPSASPNLNTNPALTVTGYHYLRSIKAHSFDAGELFARVDSAHRERPDLFIDSAIGLSPRLLDIDTEQIIMKHYADSNEWVRARYFPHQSSLFE
jgi:hypothetical protein